MECFDNLVHREADCVYHINNIDDEIKRLNNKIKELKEEKKKISLDLKNVRIDMKLYLEMKLGVNVQED